MTRWFHLVSFSTNDARLKDIQVLYMLVYKRNGMTNLLKFYFSSLTSSAIISGSVIWTSYPLFYVYTSLPLLLNLNCPICNITSYPNRWLFSYLFPSLPTAMPLFQCLVIQKLNISLIASLHHTNNTISQNTSLNLKLVLLAQFITTLLINPLFPVKCLTLLLLLFFSARIVDSRPLF